MVTVTIPYGVVEESLPNVYSSLKEQSHQSYLLPPKSTCADRATELHVI